MNHNENFGELLFQDFHKMRRSLITSPSDAGLCGLRHSEMVTLFILSRCCCSPTGDNGEGPPCTRVSALQEQLHSSKSNTSQILKALESKGYIQRRHDPQDRRSVYVYLTEVGADVVKNAHLPVIEKLSRAGEAMGAKNAENLLVLLDLLLDALSAPQDSSRKESL